MYVQRGRDGSALVAVVTIVDEEFAAIKAIENFTPCPGDSPFFYRKAVASEQYDVILAQSADRSNTPCAELVGNLAEHYRPEFIVLSGIAGGIGRDDVALGDVIIADHVEGYEIQKFDEGRSMTRRVAIDHPSKYLRETIARRVRFSEEWKKRIVVKRPSDGTPKVVVGNLIAGDKILGDGENEYQKKILNEFDKAIAVDMESHGLGRGAFSARSARHYNLNYLVVRGISDLVNAQENNEDRKLWRTYAAATAAAFSMSVVDELVRQCLLTANSDGKS
jgi:nucleoside phosphorylase